MKPLAAEFGATGVGADGDGHAAYGVGGGLGTVRDGGWGMVLMVHGSPWLWAFGPNRPGR